MCPMRGERFRATLSRPGGCPGGIPRIRQESPLHALGSPGGPQQDAHPSWAKGSTHHQHRRIEPRIRRGVAIDLAAGLDFGKRVSVNAPHVSQALPNAVFGKQRIAKTSDFIGFLRGEWVLSTVIRSQWRERFSGASSRNALHDLPARRVPDAARRQPSTGGNHRGAYLGASSVF
jgi:hypothetical protein